MATRKDMKRDFLGILKGETVKELTKQSDDMIVKKESKNKGVGMKSSKMREKIKKLLSEITHNLETGSPGTKLPRELTDKDEPGSSGSSDTLAKEETVVKHENLSLADTIRRLQAGNEGIARDYKIKTEVEVVECSSGKHKYFAHLLVGET